MDLLITPWTGSQPGRIAKAMRTYLSRERAHEASIATSSTRVVARLTFKDLINVVVPLTGWARSLRREDIGIEQNTVRIAISYGGARLEFLRFLTLVGFIKKLSEATTYEQISDLYKIARRIGENPEEGHKPILDAKSFETDLWKLLSDIDIRYADEQDEPDLAKIWLININRSASQTIFDSRKTVKADAAQKVFDTEGKGITFAVIDNGIDATHVGFVDDESPRVAAKKKDGQLLELVDLRWSSRIKATYDFSRLRQLLAEIALAPDVASATLDRRKLLKSVASDVDRHLRALAERADEGRGLDWSIAAPLIQIPHDENYRGPADDHGTHVAGILGAKVDQPEDFDRPLLGLCTKINLYDLRVFADDGNGDEFSILAALEFVGWLNRDRENPVIHGVNMSLALRHDVDSFGCGRTPICDACNQLVGSGVVVVAAAGNMGFEGSNKQSLGNGYRTVSITDPGNAEDVITVGSTHRRDPHAYGVSYFSSRGPTGDGRRKPDILAPGEKITSTIRGNRSQRLDGTSMAAPHVAGAAALLMARYPELIGQPRKIKKILMETATDLGREPAFQGAGLLDIFRALQAV
ncbi:S8 family serine peptidase [Rhizobium ruizarguesonis]